MKIAAGLLLLLVPTLALAKIKKPEPENFYVYADKGAMKNHYCPSGWMGDYGDMKVDEGNAEDCVDGKTCIKIAYNGKAAQGANWAGIYWQHPPNNWGTKPGGFDLTGYQRLTFWARGAKGGERFGDFKVGGITGEHGDSDSATYDGTLVLTKEWKKYAIDLAGKDLKHIVGALAWSASRDDNPEGFVFWLDEIRFEK